jgi:serine protease Do
MGCSMLKKKTNKLLFLLSLCLLSFIFPSSGFCSNDFLSNGFSKVAKQAIPSTVFVQGRTSSNQASKQKKQSNQQAEDPFNLFHLEFFNQFFGDSQEKKRSTQPGQSIALGSGFFINSDGYIVTNNHVVKNFDLFTVTLSDGRDFDAKLIGTNEVTDLAVLKIEGKDFPYLQLGSSDDLDVGDWAIAIGSPFGTEVSLTVGVISAKGRRLTDHPAKNHILQDFIQTDAAINPGNSGGPLLNTDGKVIGINTAIRATRDGGYIGMGFAIPSDLATIVIDSILEKGSFQRSYIGIYMQSINPDLAASFNLKRDEGALINDIVNNSPASHAGLLQGDIILKVNGKETPDVYSVQTAIALLQPGSKISIQVWRDNKEITLEVTVIAFPSKNSKIVSTKDESMDNDLGIKVQNLTPQLAQRFNYKEDQEGVIITKVDPSKTGALSGLTPGLLIISINREKVLSVEDFKSVMKKSVSKKYLLLVKKGTYTSFLSINM